MGLFVCFLLPVLAVFFVLWLCRKYNFSMIPKYLKIPSPEKFTFPKPPSNQYTWDGDDKPNDSEDQTPASRTPQRSRQQTRYYTPTIVEDDVTTSQYTSLYG